MTTNLIDINVDQLFEQHSVAEIDIIQKKIDTEVERKREELRTMVGERYRDLLKAADTIAKMKDSSGLLLTQVQSITANCKSLNDRQLIGFKTDTDVYQNRMANKQLNRYFSTVVQIKLLTSLPEMIWNHIDNERFFLATQLFIFARHISTGLQLDVNNGVMQFFPVAKKQWEVLKPFFVTIKQRVLETLDRETLTAELAADCLLSLFLLEKSSLESILKTFVQLRCTAFANSLASDVDGKRRVKDRILASLKVLYSTVELLYKCFFGTDTGLFYETLEKLSNDSSKPTISLMDLEDQELISTLPDIIAKFKPKFDVPNLPQESIQTTTSDWMKSISTICNEQLTSIFELVNSMKVIQEIKKDSLTLEKDKDWDTFCLKLHLPPSLDFYDLKYKPLINERIQDIVRQSWIKCTEETFGGILKAVKDPQKPNEVDLLWSEDVYDIPRSLKDSISNEWSLKNLLIKTKGYSGSIKSICSDFDSKLEGIVTEVDVLLNESNASRDDKLTLVAFLKATSEEQVLELISQIKSMDVERKKDTILLLARIFIAFVELCANLKICLSKTYLEEHNWSSETKSSEKWTLICSRLETESFTFWKEFCDVLLKEDDLEEGMKTTIGHDLILKDFVNWDTITIEGRDEQDNAVQSSIRIPAQPRISLQEYLFKIAKSLNTAIPQTLPTKVLHHLVSEIVTNILNHYQILAQDEFIASNQNSALQLYFDLKFLQSIFITRENRDRQDEFKKLTTSLKDLIDPFDFELFYTHLNANVKKCIQRMHFELGLLLPHPELVTGLGDAKQTSFSHEMDPNVLNLSSNGSSSTWFTLLPIIANTGRDQPDMTAIVRTEVEKVQSAPATKPKRSPRSSNSQRQSTNSKSGAAGFFGSDWFR